MTWFGRVKVERYEITSGAELSGAGGASLGFALKMIVKDLVTSHPGPPIRKATIQFTAAAGTASGGLAVDEGGLTVFLPPEQLHPVLFASSRAMKSSSCSPSAITSTSSHSVCRPAPPPSAKSGSNRRLEHDSGSTRPPEPSGREGHERTASRCSPENRPDHRTGSHEVG